MGVEARGVPCEGFEVQSVREAVELSWRARRRPLVNRGGGPNFRLRIGGHLQLRLGNFFLSSFHHIAGGALRLLETLPCFEAVFPGAI